MKNASLLVRKSAEKEQDIKKDCIINRKKRVLTAQYSDVIWFKYSHNV